MKHFLSVTGIVYSILAIALIVPNISVVITFFGSIFNPTVIFNQIMFFLPILFYVKAYPGKFTRPDLLFAIIVFVLMLVISAIAFILFIMGLAGYTLN